MAVLGILPLLFPVSQAGRTMVWLLAGTQLLLSLLTDYPAGFRRYIPFKVHSLVELALYGLLVVLAMRQLHQGDNAGFYL